MDISYQYLKHFLESDEELTQIEKVSIFNDIMVIIIIVELVLYLKCIKSITRILCMNSIYLHMFKNMLFFVNNV